MAAFVAAFAALVALAPPQATAQVQSQDTQNQDLFSQVFGDVGDQELVLPVIRSGEYLGDVSATVGATRTQIVLEEFIATIRGLLNERTVTALEELADGSGHTLVELGALNPLGITTVYRASSVELEVDIAPERLREQVLNESSRGGFSNVQTPEPLSGYVNLRSAGTVSSVDGQSSLQAEFEPVVNYQSWVVEGSTTVAAGDDPVTLNHLRLVHDLRQRQIRLEAGNARYRAGEFFSTPEVWGVSATRRGDLLPGQPLSRDGRVEFVVPRRGPVEVSLNGRVFRTYTLSPGPHAIVDLPLGRGSNQVTVTQPTEGGDGVAVLTDVLVPYAPGLLQPGRHRYSYAAGVVRDAPATPLVSASHEVGLLPQVTVRGSGQATTDRFGVGAGALAAGDWGITALDVAGTGPDGAGVAANLSHVISVLHSRWSPSVEFAGGGQNEAFRDPVTGRAAGASVHAGVAYSQRLPAAVAASLGVVRRWDLNDAARSATEVRLIASHQSPRGFALNAQIGPTITGDGVSWQGSLFVRISDDSGTVSSSAGYDLTGGPATATVQSIPRRAIDAYQWSATYQGFDRRPGQPQIVRGVVGYDGYLFNATVEPGVQQTVGADDGDYRLGGRFASAVAFAGGEVAVSRPIRDSFVLLSPRSQVAPYRVPVRGGGGSVVAVVDGRAAVMPDLQAYRPSSLSLDGSYLPDGFSVGQERYAFSPGYRSGYRMVVGSSAAVYVRGRLVDGNGEPIALEAGEVIAGDGTTLPFFTNQEGGFEITDLSPGEYRLQLYADPAAETVFAIPGDAVGRYDLEDVVFLREVQE